MANPQTENGYTRIANELLEELISYKFPPKAGLPLKPCLFVIRKTYGYDKKMDIISLSQFMEATNEKNRTNLTYWLNFLVQAKILVKISRPRGKGFVVEYGFNKNHEDWLPLVQATALVSVRKYGGISSATRGSISNDTETSISNDTHKRKKEKIKKDTKETHNSFDSFWSSYPKKVGKKNALAQWSKISEEERQAVLLDLPKRKSDDKWINGFVKDPERYLKHRQWEDEIIVPRGKVASFASAGKPGKFSNVGTKI